MPSHERQIQQIKYSLEKEINELYWSIAIRGFAVSLVGIFVPIYIYIYFNHSLMAVFAFYLSHYIGQILFLPLAARLLGKIGIKKLMAIGNPFLGLYFLSLVMAQDFGFVFIIVAALLIIIYLSIFWPARHINFSKFISKKKSGRQISTANIIIATVNVLSPLIGGFLIYKFGFAAVFIVSTLLLILSTLPLFFSPEVYEYYTLGWRQTFAKLLEKKNQRTSFSFFIEGIEYVAGLFLFPIFIFIILGHIETIGLVTSFSLLIALAFTYFIGWVSDKKGDHKVISYASVVHFFSWLVCAFIATPLQYLISASFLKLAETANHLPFMNLWYKKANAQGHGIDEFIVFHEIAHNLGRALMCVIIIAGFYFGYNSILPYFSIAALAALFFRVMK